MEDKVEFAFYVLNYDFNAEKVVNFNIFDNWPLNDNVLSLTKKHLRNKKKFPWDQYVEEVRRSIQWQEWSRREYEISVGDAFETDIEKYEKWDCYAQALPNIEIIARECIYQYKQWKKQKATKK